MQGDTRAAAGRQGAAVGSCYARGSARRRRRRREILRESQFFRVSSPNAGDSFPCKEEEGLRCVPFTAARQPRQCSGCV